MGILDASAIIALIDKESGQHLVAEAMATGAGVCTANLAEVAAWLSRKRHPADTIRRIITNLPLLVFDVTQALALEAGLLFSVTRAFGLSLGDRLCLALAARERQPVLTADRIWREAGPLIGVEVRLIR